jgi:outer membrane protein assembly factor BamB
MVTPVHSGSYQVAATIVPEKSPYDGSYKIATIRANDGKIISNKSLRKFGDLYHGDPMFGEDDTYLLGTLPVTIKSFIRKMSGTLGYPHWPMDRTRLEHSGNLWFIGKINHDVRKGTIFALDGKTGDTVWKREVPGLEEILVYKGKLVAASFMVDQYRLSKSSAKNKLMALDEKTGKVFWTTVVPD